MGNAASFSSSSFLPPKKYDVFISFRGEDTRTNFTSHLYTALCQKSIRTYIDHELPKGDDISQSIIQAIHDSCISVVVFSENYAFSTWCLDELTHILQCREDERQFVIPVFYKVDPSDVCEQNGTYKDAFAKHKQDFIHNHDKINKWKHALFRTANVAGWVSETMDEAKLIQNIVNDILRKLNHRYPSALKGLVGIDENCQRIELLLQNVPIVGIWGVGGIGKTTMAKAVFAKLCSQYDSCCFVENVREESEKHGPKLIRDKLVSELLENENLHCSTSEFGSTFVMSRLSSKKVFIVLDDVNSSKQLDDLAREYDYLGSGSRVIITTRDKDVLTGRVNEIHEINALSDHESFKLFCFKAFRKVNPEIGYEQLAKRAIVYAKGIPLALTVLGSYLYSKSIEEWDSALTNLEKSTREDIQEVLKLSYDGLNFQEKEMFLDIACFLKGEDKKLVIKLFESYGFDARSGIRNLQDKSLIVTTTLGRVWMHDLIQGMGWEIVRQECIKKSGKCNCCWNPDEAGDLVNNNRGTHAVEGIMLSQSQIEEVRMLPRKRTLDRRTFLDKASLLPCDTTLEAQQRGYCIDCEHGDSSKASFVQEIRDEIAKTRHKHQTLVEAIAGLQNMQQAMIEMVGMIIQREQGRDHRSHQEKGIEVSLHDFLKLRPPSFSGIEVNEDPLGFLDRIDRVCRALRCSSTRSVELASFRLKGMAQTWFETLFQRRSSRSPPMTWQEFTELFMRRFLTKSVRDAKVKEFESLSQTEGMPVLDYEIQFTQLSQYAPHLVASEETRAKRFVHGLQNNLFKLVARTRYDSYEDVVESARFYESQSKKSCSAQESCKRPRTEGPQGSHQGQSGGNSRSEIIMSQPGHTIGSQNKGGHRRQSSSTTQSGKNDQSSSSQFIHGQGRSSRTSTTCPTCGRLHSGVCCGNKKIY